MTQEVLLYLITGATTGLFAGLLGIGGGIIVIPILHKLFGYYFPADQVMHMAIGTSLAIMIFTATSSAYAYQRRGLVLWSLFRQFAPGLAFGTVAGSIIAMHLTSRNLSIAFAIFLFFIAAFIFYSKPIQAQKKLPHSIGMTLSALAIGLLCGFFGIGGGTMMVPFFAYCNVEMHKATGTSAICGLLLAVTGTASLALTGLNATSPIATPWGTTGFVYWPAALVIAAASVIFAPLGTRLAVWLPSRVLKKIFAVIIVATALFLLA